jgi:hypothetical protein
MLIIGEKEVRKRYQKREPGRNRQFFNSNC